MKMVDLRFIYIGLKTTLMGFTLWTKIHVLVKATEGIEAQSWSKSHVFVTSSYDF